MLLPSSGAGLQDTKSQQLSGSPAGLLQAGMVEEGDGYGNGFSFNTHWLQMKVPVWCDTAWADTRNYFAAIAKLLQPTLVFPLGLLFSCPLAFQTAIFPTSLLQQTPLQVCAVEREKLPSFSLSVKASVRVLRDEACPSPYLVSS